MLLDNAKGQKKIGELTARLVGREPPLILEDARMPEIIDAMIRCGHSRLLYVIDSDEKLIGTISLGTLIRHVFSRSHEPQIHARRLMKAITSETAKHLMQKHPVVAEEEEPIRVVVERMIKSNVKEIAIVDRENRVIADVTILDFLQFLSE